MSKANGRAARPLPTFTFKDTGITVHIRKVSPMLGMEIRKAFPPPRPPVVQTAIGPEENDADPDYARALEDYRALLEEKAAKLYIRRGVECDVDTAAVAALRAEMADLGVTLDADDKIVYVRYLCVGSGEDYQELIEAITRRSQPTEAAVAEAVETFSAPLPGA